MWLVSPRIRGGIGLNLLLRAISVADFSIIVGGSPYAQNIYPRIKFTLKFHIPTYYKLIKPIAYFRSATSYSLLKRIAKTLYLSPSIPSRKCSEELQRNIELRVHPLDSVEPYPSTGHSISNIIDIHQLRWIMKHPALKSYVCSIMYRGTSIGLSVCYINDHQPAAPTGRIVHISYLGDNEMIWHTALLKVEAFLRDYGCSVISTMSSHPIFAKALKDAGYISCSKGTPCYMRDVKNALPGIPNDDWHLTFVEGDSGFRGV